VSVWTESEKLGGAALPTAQELSHAIRYFASLGVSVRRVMTDNGGAFCSKMFRHTCPCLDIKHISRRGHTPQTKGKAEPFSQSALHEWAYDFLYSHSSQRASMLEDWIHHYHWHQPTRASAGPGR